MDAEAFAATERACNEVGWLFRRLAGPGPVLAANLRWLAGYRHQRCLSGELADDLLRRFSEPQPIFETAAQAGDRLAVLPVVYHLMWRQMLQADLQARPLGPETLVCATGAGR